VTIPATPAWFDAIRDTYALGSDDEALLALAEQAYGRWRELATRIDEDGVMVPGRYEGVERAHPLLGAERAARNAVAEILVKLKLPPVPED
jgi:hypothetical protein